MKQLQQIFEKFPWLNYVLRGVICLLVLILVGNIGFNTLLGLVFNGPSETARNVLTLTLLETPDYKHIPGKFLDDATIQAIVASANAAMGTVDESLIQPGSGSSSADTVTLERCTAKITVVPAINQITLNKDSGITLKGNVLTSEEGNTVLILNGSVNEPLYNGPTGYAARLAIGQMADGSVILVTTDGGSREVPGATYQNMIDIMVEYGAVNAWLLTPGSASGSEE